MNRRNADTFGSLVDRPGELLTFTEQRPQFRAGLRCACLIVQRGSLLLAGELDIGEVIVVAPQDADGTPIDAIDWQGATGRVGAVSTLMTRRDHSKMGSGTHDLTIGYWLGRSALPPPLPPDFAPGDPNKVPHRDGIQVMRAQRVTIGYYDFQNLHPGATNGALFVQPNKNDPDVDDTDPSLCCDVVIEGGVIVNPNSCVVLGACTRCGARNTTMIAQRPFRSGAHTQDAVDQGNTKAVVSLSGLTAVPDPGAAPA